MEINVPDNATNGDMIKAMFPDCEVNEHKVQTNSQGALVVGYDVFLYAYHPNESDMGLGFGIKIFFDNMWWNAPYKTEIEKLQPIKPQEPCEDAISRQAAIDAFQMFREYESNRSNKEWVDRIETVLNQLPPVNPTKTGHWIEEKPNVYKCSECGAYALEWGGQCLASNYCPNCGAKMIDPQESEDKK